MALDASRPVHDPITNEAALQEHATGSDVLPAAQLPVLLAFPSQTLQARQACPD
eukprot:CAMPEP_0113724538 /NCGR_PEP_ID=MMETSP0038_2-20120614/39147_1 /TAXON_ID=2898 /ORGANISM="Cryptomonas paramecium" /LENGTH=53 /DNA_ID=CAMNT_0000654475 /DNA_START=90 /DNA_END=252 /DNA_ORIENTATION=- /assembly_acc=CAM_ASM_000170